MTPCTCTKPLPMPNGVNCGRCGGGDTEPRDIQADLKSLRDTFQEGPRAIAKVTDMPIGYVSQTMMETMIQNGWAEKDGTLTPKFFEAQAAALERQLAEEYR